MLLFAAPAPPREVPNEEYEAALERFNGFLARRARGFRWRGEVDRAELLQVCRITLWRLMRRGHPTDHPDFEKYLQGALSNAMLTHMRARGLEREVRQGRARMVELDAPGRSAKGDDDMPGFQLADERERDPLSPERLDYALRRLPRPLRWVFEDRYLYGLSVAAIARQQRAPEHEVRHRLDRATALVVDVLRNGMDVDGP